MAIIQLYYGLYDYNFKVIHTKEKIEMSKVIGIDLGTTNSCVAVLESGDAKVIENAEGNRTTPSVVGFTKEGERPVGQVAKRQAITNPQNTIFSIKRFMGRKFNEIGDDASRVPYTLKADKDGDVAVNIEGKDYSSPEISAMVLRKMKETAEAYLGEEVTKAVITVPTDKDHFFNFGGLHLSISECLPARLKGPLDEVICNLLQFCTGERQVKVLRPAGIHSDKRQVDVRL